jgi:hypothetical protein
MLGKASRKAPCRGGFQLALVLSAASSFDTSAPGSKALPLIYHFPKPTQPC